MHMLLMPRQKAADLVLCIAQLHFGGLAAAVCVGKGACAAGPKHQGSCNDLS